MELNAPMLEQVLVAVIVGVALLVSVWKLMPARGRMRLLLALDRWSARRPRLARWRERSLKPRIARAGGVGCDGCAAHPQQVAKRSRSPR
ncbi:MAG TPA: DUF6587 family protein [Steroidobacteraceae bacterium]|nr:DUF6587 family protein [Steroidobacteraceae bacterium]